MLFRLRRNQNGSVIVVANTAHEAISNALNVIGGNQAINGEFEYNEYCEPGEWSVLIAPRLCVQGEGSPIFVKALV